METKKKTNLDKAKEEIIECLYTMSKNGKDPLSICLRIESILNENRISRALPYVDFLPKYKTFINTHKKSPQKAEKNFLSFLDLKPDVANIAKVKEVSTRRTRGRERGVSKANKELLDAWRLLHETDKVIKESGVDISKSVLFELIKISNYLLQNQKSIDSFLDSKGYSDSVKELIARSLGTFLVVDMQFRRKWYPHYYEKIKTVVKFPHAGIYHKQAKEDVVDFKINTRGKSTTEKKIHDHARNFIEQIKDKNYYTGFRDREFYNEYGFKALLQMVGELQDILYAEIDKKLKKELDVLSPKVTRSSSEFSVDAYISKIHRNAGNKNIIVGRLKWPDWNLKASIS